MPPRGTGWRARALTIAAALAIGGVGAWILPRLNVTSEITQFLPSSEDRELAELAQDMSRSDLNRTITVTIGGENRAAAARELARALERNRDVEWVRRGPSEDLDEAFYDLYFPRRLAFHDDEPHRLTDEELRTAARDLKSRLTSPTGTFIRQIAPDDPLLAFAHHLDRLRDAQGGGLEAIDGQFVTADGHAVVFFASRASPFDPEPTARLMSALDRTLDRVRARHRVTIESSALHRFAVSSQRSIRADVQRISTVSSIAIAILFLVLFRSFRYVILSAVPLAAGMVVGLVATELAFGHVHGMALAFGSTLIGVAVDFGTHYLNHHTLAPSPGGPWASMRHILPGLALGAGTTIAGLAGLAWTSFPGISELAFFSTVGVSASLLATVVLLPPWMPVEPKPTRLLAWIARSLTSAMNRLRGARFVRYAIPLVALMVCAAGFAKLEWVDDIRALNALDPVLVAEDERVRARVSRMDAGRFVIAWGADDEEALRRNDEVHRRLLDAQANGELEAMRSLHELLWSARAQRASYDAIARDRTLRDRFSRALEAEGFVETAFDPFWASSSTRPTPLGWRELAGSPIGALAQSFRFERGGRVAFVTLLRGADVGALERRMQGLSGVRVFDQTEFMSGAYGEFRERTIELVAAGLIGVFLLIFARYRRLRPSIAAFAPAVLAAATSIAIVVLLGVQPTLMHLVAVLLVLSMGEDYAVFVVEAHDAGDEIGTAMSSVLNACLTTVLSFGLLAMSANPALRALGSITGLGVLLSMVLTPTGWLFLPEKKT